MVRPLVSIIIPVHNGSRYLSEAITSALSQTYSPIEVIVINDGSDDHNATRFTAKSFGESVTYFEKANGGVASALNLGIKLMRGEYFSWLSHDDLYYPEKIESQIDSLQSVNRENRVAYSNYSVVDSGGNMLYAVDHDHLKLGTFRSWLMYEYTNGLNGCTLLIPKNLIEKNGLFNETLIHTQDYDYWFKLARTADFTLIDSRLVALRTHDAQTSIVFPTDARKEQDEMFERFTKEISANELYLYTGLSYAKSLELLGRTFKKRKLVSAAKTALRLMKYT